MKKDKDFILNAAKGVIELEAKSLYELATYIDDSFVEVVELFNKCVWRIIVSGVGKSAIIAMKIVATFNPIGTFASFMHSADAVHGDVRRMAEKGDDYSSIKAGDIMSVNPKTISVKELAVEAFNIMEANKITSIIVLEDGAYVGLIHIHDIIKEGIA